MQKRSEGEWQPKVGIKDGRDIKFQLKRNQEEAGDIALWNRWRREQQRESGCGS